MENAPEIQNEKTQLAKQSDIPGMEDFPNSSIVVPRLIIGQPGNQSGFPEGKFINNLTEETFDELNVVLLRFKRTRTLWAPGVPKKGDAPQCRAQNAIEADSEFRAITCTRCHRIHDFCVKETIGKEQPYCEHAKFTENFRPECRLGYHLMLLSHPNADLFILTVTGKGISPTNRLLSNFKLKGRPPYSAVFKIMLDAAIGGNYYTIRYGNFRWLEDPDELKAMYETFKDVQLSTVKEEDHAAE